MAEKDDWRLLINDVEYLKDKEINPTDGFKIEIHFPYLKECIFCEDKVACYPHRRWFIPTDISCCICEECFNDFKAIFHWKELDGSDIDLTLRCPKCKTELDVNGCQDYPYFCENCNTLYDYKFDDELELRK